MECLLIQRINTLTLITVWNVVGYTMSETHDTGNKSLVEVEQYLMDALADTESTLDSDSEYLYVKTDGLVADLVMTKVANLEQFEQVESEPRGMSPPDGEMYAIREI